MSVTGLPWRPDLGKDPAFGPERPAFFEAWRGYEAPLRSTPLLPEGRGADDLQSAGAKRHTASHSKDDEPWPHARIATSRPARKRPVAGSTARRRPVHRAIPPASGRPSARAHCCAKDVKRRPQTPDAASGNVRVPPLAPVRDRRGGASRPERLEARPQQR